MAFFDFLGNLGQKAQDATQNIPGADIVDQASQAIGDPAAVIGDAAQDIPGADTLDQAGQTVSDVGSGISDATQNVAGSAAEQLGNLTDKLPKL
jgi:hypothetical protein